MQDAAYMTHFLIESYRKSSKASAYDQWKQRNDKLQ